MAEELSLVISNPNEGEFLQKIDWNKEEFMELVASITKQYEGMTYTEDQMKAAKDDRAKLNAMKKAISDRRIQVKNAVMAPYTQFEKEVKEVVTLIDGPISLIDRQIKEYEEAARQEKLSKLIEYFAEVAAEYDGILTFDMIFDQKWLNAGTSLKKAKEEISIKVDKFQTDIHTIETMVEPQYQTAVKSCYMRSLNITNALNEAGRLKELDRKMEEERLRKEEEEERRAEADAQKVEENVQKTVETVPETPESVQKQAESVQEPAESVAEPPAGNSVATDPFTKPEDTKQYKASFTVYGTKNQIMALKEYMISNNIKFGKVGK